jgi:glucoamylase
MQSMTSGLGMVPEQAWEDPAVAASPYGSDPATASIGFANGKPAGSASPLIWAQAQYLRLVTDLGSGSLGDQPGIVADRYVRHAPPGVLPVAVTATVSGSQITVSGTARAGSTVVIAAGQPTASSDTTVVVSAVTGPDGHFRATVPLHGGTNVITAAGSDGAHATGWAQVSVTS